ncbi:hypothetical protein Tco_0076474, partial [Tanacetum coccineum]
VLDLEKTKTTQHNEIASLKRRVKKLEKKNRSRTHRLKRLYKVGLTTRVEYSGDEESLGEDASKQGRIDAINADEEITLVSVHDVNVSAGEEVFIAEQDDVKEVNDKVNVVEEVVEVINSAKLIIYVAQVSAAGDIVSTASAATTVSVATTTTITTVDDITLAQALVEIKSTKPKMKGVVIQELGESTTTISSQISSQLSSQQSQDKGKGILIEPVKDGNGSGLGQDLVNPYPHPFIISKPVSALIPDGYPISIIYRLFGFTSGFRLSVIEYSLDMNNLRKI